MFMVASNTARERNQAPDDAPFLDEALGVVALGKRIFSVSGVIVEQPSRQLAVSRPDSWI